MLIIPGVLTLLRLTKRYYRQIDRTLAPAGRLRARDLRPPIVIIPISN